MFQGLAWKGGCRHQQRLVYSMEAKRARALVICKELESSKLCGAKASKFDALKIRYQWLSYALKFLFGFAKLWVSLSITRMCHTLANHWAMEGGEVCFHAHSISCHAARSKWLMRAQSALVIVVMLGGAYT